MKITSDDLKNGVWDDSISHLTCGKNESPQLSIEPGERRRQLCGLYA
jgi:hypothetical protein